MFDKTNVKISNEKKDAIIKVLNNSPQFKISFFKFLSAKFKGKNLAKKSEDSLKFYINHVVNAVEIFSANQRNLVISHLVDFYSKVKTFEGQANERPSDFEKAKTLVNTAANKRAEKKQEEYSVKNLQQKNIHDELIVFIDECHEIVNNNIHKAFEEASKYINLLLSGAATTSNKLTATDFITEEKELSCYVSQEDK